MNVQYEKLAVFAKRGIKYLLGLYYITEIQLRNYALRLLREY